MPPPPPPAFPFSHSTGAHFTRNFSSAHISNDISVWRRRLFLDVSGRWVVLGGRGWRLSALRSWLLVSRFANWQDDKWAAGEFHSYIRKYVKLKQLKKKKKNSSQKMFAIKSFQLRQLLLNFCQQNVQLSVCSHIWIYICVDVLHVEKYTLISNILMSNSSGWKLSRYFNRIEYQFKLILFHLKWQNYFSMEIPCFFGLCTFIQYIYILSFVWSCVSCSNLPARFN